MGEGSLINNLIIVLYKAVKDVQHSRIRQTCFLANFYGSHKGLVVCPSVAPTQPDYVMLLLQGYASPKPLVDYHQLLWHSLRCYFCEQVPVLTKLLPVNLLVLIQRKVEFIAYPTCTRPIR